MGYESSLRLCNALDCTRHARADTDARRVARDALAESLKPKADMVGKKGGRGRTGTQERELDAAAEDGRVTDAVGASRNFSECATGACCAPLGNRTAAAVRSPGHLHVDTSTHLIRTLLRSFIVSTKMPATKTAAPAKQTVSHAQSHPLLSLWNAYYESTSTRLKTIDAFLVFLVLSGVIQFLYCILVSNFPFNAFLAG